jgi:hypothetical protein
MPDCLATNQFSTEMKKKLTTQETVRYRIKLIKSISFLVWYRYWTEIMDAGMPMPALVSRCRYQATYIAIGYTVIK